VSCLLYGYSITYNVTQQRASFLVFQNSMKCARLSAGATIEMLKAVVSDQITNGLAVIRFVDFNIKTLFGFILIAFSFILSVR